MRTLGLNIDHIATLREARKINEPDPLEAVFVAKNCGVKQITLHLREDRRHINDDDLRHIIKHSPLPVNVECSCNDEIINIVSSLNPYKITLVPENRAEVTTEGGLLMNDKTKAAMQKFIAKDISVAVFIDPDPISVSLAKDFGAREVEIHTGKFSNIYTMLFSNLIHTKHAIKSLQKSQSELKKMLQNEIVLIRESAILAQSLGLYVCAGHGLNTQNLPLITPINEIAEYNIGHSIIARSIFVGLSAALKEILDLLR